MSHRLWRLLLALPLVLAACGGGTLLISFNSGEIVGNPTCRGGGGEFDLRESGGLVVVVLITSSTTILVSSGGAGSCQDLFPGAPVEVRGHDSGDRIVATRIVVN